MHRRFQFLYFLCLQPYARSWVHSHLASVAVVAIRGSDELLLTWQQHTFFFFYWTSDNVIIGCKTLFWYLRSIRYVFGELHSLHFTSHHVHVDMHQTKPRAAIGLITSWHVAPLSTFQSTGWWEKIASSVKQPDVDFTHIVGADSHSISDKCTRHSSELRHVVIHALKPSRQWYSNAAESTPPHKRVWEEEVCIHLCFSQIMMHLIITEADWK